jgi:hypothetical protein
MQLRQYLYDREIPAASFAERIGVSVQAVHRYINGDRMPRRDVMERIKVATRGAVQPNDFFRCEAAE